MSTITSMFNLVDEPWIGVAGHPRQSLKMFFSNPALRNFSGNAIDKIAMLRFMLALGHAAVEFRSDAEYRAVSPEQLAARILDYLDAHHDQFNFFGERPFLQFPQLREKSQKALPYSALLPGVAANRPILTNWVRNPEVKTEDLPLLLLRGCGLELGKKISDNFIVLSPGYRGKLNDKENKKCGVAGTLIGSQGYLHTYLRGETLLETIKLNMLTREDVDGTGAFQGMGRPAWEDMPEGEDSPRARAYCDSYQGTLLPLDRFHLFLPEKKLVVMTDGIPYPNHLTGLADPALTIRGVKNKIEAVWAKTQYRPWRELPAILSFLEAAEGKKSPFTLSRGIRKLPGEAAVHVWTAGVQVSSNAGEQFISGKDDYIESDFYFPNQRINDFCYKRFANTMKTLDNCAKKLYGSVAGYFKELSDPQSADQASKPASTRKVRGSGADIAAQSTAVFWEMAEKDAQRIIDAVFTEELTDCDAPPELAKEWRRLVLEQYSRSCPRDTARQLLAWSKCKPFAGSKTKKTSKNRSEI